MRMDFVIEIYDQQLRMRENVKEFNQLSTRLPAFKN